MAPDRQSTDAAAATAAVTDMHDVVVRKAHDLDATPAKKTLASGKVTAEPEITRRDVHTASSINAQRRYSRVNPEDSNLVRQAAINRSVVKGKGPAQIKPTDSSSFASSKPVLVRAPSTGPGMKRKTKIRVGSESPQLPTLESFSIQDILNSIGPEADASIEAIAEICGRSKMSLAEEHGSHRPPHVQLVTTGSSPAESLPSMRLEPVSEVDSNGPHTRSKSRFLKLANVIGDGETVPADATAAISNVTSHAHLKHMNTRQDESLAAPASTPLFSQVSAWLRRSIPGNEVAEISRSDGGIEDSLRSMLSDTDSIRS